MSDERDGLIDPWRRGTPAPPKDGPTNEKVGLPGSQHPLDWDIQPDIMCTLRIPGTYGALTIHNAQTPEGAAIIFLQHIELVPLLRERLEQNGFHFTADTTKEPAVGYTLHTPDKTKALYNPDVKGTDAAQVVRIGFSHLIRALLRESRQDAKFRLLLKTLGVEPLLT